MMVRVRLAVLDLQAPSTAAPRLSVGGARLALAGWLFARHEGGAAVLSLGRMELGAVGAACDDLRWLGLDWDESASRRSGRQERYLDCARRLVDARLADERDPPLGCVDLAPVPHPLAFDDLILPNHTLAGGAAMRDPVPLVSGGMPTPTLCDVVDDHEGAITHVFCAQQRLLETSAYLQLCAALGWIPPRFAHLPGLADPQLGRLPLSALREKGYPGTAVANYLARLGWTPRGKRELLSLAVLAERFEIARLSRVPAVADRSQLEWFGRRALSQLDPDELMARLVPRWEAAYGVAHRAQGTALRAEAWQRALTAAIRDGMSCLDEALERARFAFADDVVLDARARDLLAQPYADEVLGAFVEGLPAVEPFAFDPLDAYVSDLRLRFKASHGIRSRDVMHVIRAALTGRQDGPCLVAACELLGPERCAERASRFLDSATLHRYNPLHASRRT